jgi:uncharacterized protein YecE (DUF72 family)
VHKPVVPAIYIGCPIWNNKEWLGKIYPATAKEKDYLKYYSQQFNTIELNTTHYRIPDTATIERWKNAVAKWFTFCPKFPQQISHELQLRGAEELTDIFCDAIRGLNKHLGISFLQLPPYFTPKQLANLEHFVMTFPQDVPLAIEFRHPEWFINSQAVERAFTLLEQFNIGTVITDVAGRRDVLHQRLTTPVATIRFVGHGLHPTDYSRIDSWVKRLLQWFDQGLHTLYFFMHQPENTYSPELILYLIRQLNKLGGFRIAEPRLTIQPVQGSLF